MNDTREIYWNLGHWVVLPMYALAALAAGILIVGFARRLRVWRLGQPEARSDQPASRLGHFLNAALAQARVLRVRNGGVQHAFFFWSFGLLFVATLLIMAQVDLLEPVFDVTILVGAFYRGFSLVTDIAGLVALLALLALAIRRFVLRPEGLITAADDYLIHGLLIAILLTGFVIEGSRMAVTEVAVNDTLAHWSPIGLLIAYALDPLGDAKLVSLHRALWWLHFGLVAAFIAAVPFTKLRHLFTTPINNLLRSTKPKGLVTTLDLEDETTEQFGAARVADLRWKDIFDSDACTACKRCQDRCPAWSTGKPLSPMKLVQAIGDVAVAGPQAELAQAISADAVWACTTCRACEEICPAEIEHVEKVVALRRNLVLMEGAFAGEEVERAARSTEMSGNPLGLPGNRRSDWAAGLDVSLVSDGEPFDVLYFAGCYASFDPRNQRVARAFVTICRAAGVRVGVLGGEERCCGEPMRKLGNEYLYQMLATENVASIARSGATRVVVTCPHCYATLDRDYRELGLRVDVEHHATFIRRLLASGELQLAPAPLSATYHDSCYLGRTMDVFDAPREVISAAGIRIAEMPRHGRESFCCGGGGGRVLADERLGTRISHARVAEAQATGATALVSNCPFCLTMFEDAAGSLDLARTLRPRDLAEVVAERLTSPATASMPDDHAI
ncbi:MAG: heterodisulfide reductase-related iron-sulfur binding cluster [Thermoleophilia bacterium]